jgi:hypothetical protein
MATLEELVVQLTAETASLRAEMAGATKAVQQSTDKMDKALKEFSENSNKNVSFAQQAMATFTGFLGSQAVLGAFNALKDAAGFMFAQLGEGAEAAMAQEAALRRLGQSLALAGNFSQEALTDLAGFTDEMEKLTGVGDDVVASNLAVLSSLTQLDANGLKKAQKSALDMSAALGIDLDSATKKVAQAINGQEGALARYGIQLDLGADKTQNMATVTEALGRSFGGAAQGQMMTFAGALKSVQNGFGNFFESIASAVTQNPVFVAALQQVSKILNELTDSATSNGAYLQQVLAKAFIFVADSIYIAIEAFSKFIKVIEAGVQGVLLIINGLADGIRLLVDVLDGTKDNDDAFAATKQRFEDLTQAVEGQNALDKFNEKLWEVRDAGATAFGTIKQGADAAVPSMDVVNQKTVQLTEAQIAYNESLKGFAVGLAEQNAALFQSLDYKRELLEASRSTEMEDDAAYFEERMALEQERFQAENDALVEARANNLISEEQYLAARDQLQQQYELQSLKTSQERMKSEEALNKQRAANFKDTMSTISSLSSSGNKELAAIGKAAAITNATIDGYAAVQKALSSAPPPFNFALAALVGAATAANVAKISGVGLQSGITEVPRSAGGGNLGDNFPAVLNPGERVVDSQTNQDLKAFLANQGGGSQVNVSVTVMPGTGLNNEQIGNLIEQMNNYFNSGGLKLVGAS